MSGVVFDTRLGARSLLEASAGTGKTWTLAGVFVRAVIEARLAVPQVLAVTYTVAATRELRARVHRRLQQAAGLAAQWREGDPPTRPGDDADTALLRRLLHAALDDAGTRESLPALRLRLARAVRDIDLAAISTIHGFCQRLLAEHALDASQPLLAAQVEARNRAARTRLAVDLWRDGSRDADGATFLRRTFGGIAGRDGLAEALHALLAPEPLLPPAPEAMADDPRPRVATAWRALRAEFERDGAAVRERLLAAIDARVLKNSEYKAEHVDALWDWCAAHDAATPPEAIHPKLAKYLPTALRAGTSKAAQGGTPEAPLFAAFDGYAAARSALAPWREAEDLRRLHALRAAACRRDAERKRAFHVRDYDDLIGAVHAAAVDPARRDALRASLQAQFPLALVDEFQDTDFRQWAIFEALFGGGGLVLVGDPKQAIYRFRGGDVHTYLAARASAEDTHALSRNFRSRPCLLAAIDALFAHAPRDALGAGIAFQPVAAGGTVADDDLRRGDAAAAAIAFHVVPPKRVPSAGGGNRDRDWTADESLDIGAGLCADAVRDALSTEPPLRRRDGDGHRLLEPRDCAVLVRTHREADAVRRALSRRGVPAVASGRTSLFHTEEAQALLVLLLALRGSGDDRRLRAALATRLIGLDAAGIIALDDDDDGDALRGWQQTFEGWRARWERHGPQALLAEVVAAQAPRLLTQVDGERRITDLLQLAELMQEAGTRSLGTQGQLDWLRAAIADADPDDEAQQPRLESDAGRVQVLTLHKSKGLEFPLVFLPFVGLGRRDLKPKQFATYPGAGGRVRQWRTAHAHPGAPAWDDGSPASAVALHLAEDAAEDMRLLYVGLTRARDALWLCCGALASHANTALQRLLGGSEPAPALLAALGAAATRSEGLPGERIRRLPTAEAADIPPARTATRRLQRDWWIHSFSQLHQQKPHGVHALADDAPADDERVVAADTAARADTDPRFAGVRFGNALHHALEHADFAAWRDHDGSDDIPAGQREILLTALRSQGYREPEFDAGQRELAVLVARTLNAPLPDADGVPRVRLCDLPDDTRIAEMEFHFGLRGAASSELLALLHAHGLLRGRRDFGGWQRLSGLMTGKLDLTYRFEGRVYVLDYKSNLLPGYDQSTLAGRMAASEYELQALLYAVAVQRWLRARLGAEYHFDRHFGGARYVFSRGLDPRDASLGVYVPALPPELVDAADALLATPPRGPA